MSDKQRYHLDIDQGTPKNEFYFVTKHGILGLIFDITEAHGKYNLGITLYDKEGGQQRIKNIQSDSLDEANRKLNQELEKLDPELIRKMDVDVGAKKSNIDDLKIDQTHRGNLIKPEKEANKDGTVVSPKL